MQGRRTSLFSSYFSAEAVREMDLIYSKYWSIILYMRYQNKKTNSTMVTTAELKAMSGYYIWNKVAGELIEAKYPIIQQSKELYSKSYYLTKFGIWLADQMWKTLDCILSYNKEKTLTQMLIERTTSLKMTIEEINSIAPEEKEEDALHETLINDNNLTPSQ